jgi:hypothetical protein
MTSRSNRSGLIAERGEDLDAEQLIALLVDNENCFAASERQARHLGLRFRLGRGDAGHRRLEAAAACRDASDIYGPAMLTHDLAYRRETQPGAFGARREKRFEDSAERRLVHAASGIAHRDAHVMSRRKIAVAERSRQRDVLSIDLEVNAPLAIHRLRRVVAEIEG